LWAKKVERTIQISRPVIDLQVCKILTARPSFSSVWKIAFSTFPLSNASDVHQPDFSQPPELGAKDTQPRFRFDFV